MNANTKELENANLTDGQTGEVTGGIPALFRPFPRNAKLEDKQADQVSGGHHRVFRSEKPDEDEPSKVFNQKIVWPHEPKPDN